MKKDEFKEIEWQAHIMQHKKAQSKLLSEKYPDLKRVIVKAKYFNGFPKERNFTFDTDFLKVECNGDASTCKSGGIDISNIVDSMVNKNIIQNSIQGTCQGRLRSPTNLHYQCNNSIVCEILLEYEK